MNIVMHNGAKRWYVATVSKHGEVWRAYGLFFDNDGNHLRTGQSSFCYDRSDAEKRCRSMARIKKKHKGYQYEDISNFPEAARKHLNVDSDKWVSADEMIRMINMAKNERYVYFADVNGIEEWFDAGVQYLGILSSDEYLVDVYDKFGTLRAIMTSRFDRMELTEEHQEMINHSAKTGEEE